MIRTLHDLQRGVSSPHGYTAMYKSDIWLDGLHHLMSNILFLSEVHVAGRDQTPTFVCVRPHMELDLDIGINPFGHCQEAKVTSFWVKDTTVIFLCERFMDMLLQPAFSPSGPWDIYCPVVQDNVFPGVSDPLVKYQCYDLVYQLAHLYLQHAGLTNETVPKEAQDWNSCVALGGGSGRNAFNLVYYTAFVNQGCTQMPDPFSPPFSLVPPGPGGTGLLSISNSAEASLTNLTHIRLQS